MFRSLALRGQPEPVYNSEVEGDHCYRVEEQGLLVHHTSVPKHLYRGDRCGLRAMGFDSFEAKSQGRIEALKDLLTVDTDELDRRMEKHATSRFLSWFVSATSDIRIACYFATTGCTTPGCIYVLEYSSLARYNPYNTLDVTLCDGKTVAQEQEWVWFSFVDSQHILDEIMVTPDDCKHLSRY